MKNWIVALLVSSLLGLGYIQYRLLMTGLQLQKTNLDKKVEQILRSVKKQLNEPIQISKDIALLATFETSLSRAERDSIKQKGFEEINYLLNQKFEEKEVYGVDFSFFISSPGRKEIFFGSEKITEQHSKNSHYKQPLSGAIAEDCHCQLVLELHVQNLFNYLLKQVQYLLLPSLLFLVLIAFCFIWFLRMLNKERKLARVKNDFINNLTHEFKTPVFSISLASKMLGEYLKEHSSPKPKEYLQLIRQENEKIKGHIDKILELATLEDSQYIMDVKEVEINDFLKTITDSFLEKVDIDNAALKVIFLEKEEIIFLDKTHFSNALQNLLENTLKYRKEEFLNILVSLKKINNQLSISIKDNGKGISKEDQKYIFNKFYRVTTGNLHDIKGFGLGLSYVKQVVERHNGKITIESELGKGSLFTLHFDTLA